MWDLYRPRETAIVPHGAAESGGEIVHTLSNFGQRKVIGREHQVDGSVAWSGTKRGRHRQFRSARSPQSSRTSREARRIGDHGLHGDAGRDLQRPIGIVADTRVIIEEPAANVRARNTCS